MIRSRPWKTQPDIHMAIHRGPVLNCILLKLTDVCYKTINDGILGYQDPKIDKKIIIPSLFCMSIWQVQIHKTTILSATNRWYVKAKTINEILKICQTHFGIVDYILTVSTRLMVEIMTVHPDT